MKYVRTKNGIYEANSQIEPEKELQIKWIDDHCFATSWKTKPCDWQVADTIEELCDYVFYVNSIGTHYYLNLQELSKSEIKLIENYFKNGNYKECKFCIETDKGLIYVAKMNEKGELELL